MYQLPQIEMKINKWTNCKVKQNQNIILTLKNELYF